MDIINLAHIHLSLYIMIADLDWFMQEKTSYLKLLAAVIHSFLEILFGLYANALNFFLTFIFACKSRFEGYLTHLLPFGVLQPSPPINYSKQFTFLEEWESKIGIYLL